MRDRAGEEVRKGELERKKNLTLALDAQADNPESGAEHSLQCSACVGGLLWFKLPHLPASALVGSGIQVPRTGVTCPLM